MAARSRLFYQSCEDLLTLDRLCSKTVSDWSHGKDRRSDWCKCSHSQGRQARRAKHAPDKTSFRRENFESVVKCFKKCNIRSYVMLQELIICRQLYVIINRC